jgi:hypothetical protein
MMFSGILRAFEVSTHKAWQLQTAQSAMLIGTLRVRVITTSDNILRTGRRQLSYEQAVGVRAPAEPGT